MIMHPYTDICQVQTASKRNHCFIPCIINFLNLSSQNFKFGGHFKLTVMSMRCSGDRCIKLHEDLMLQSINVHEQDAGLCPCLLRRTSVIAHHYTAKMVLRSAIFSTPKSGKIICSWIQNTHLQQQHLRIF